MRLTEIAFKQKPYKWTYNRRTSSGRDQIGFFDKDKNEYTVNIVLDSSSSEKKHDMIWFDFHVRNDWVSLTNANDVIRVMSTMMNIIDTYVKDIPTLKHVKFELGGDKGTKRFALYKAVAKAHGYTISKLGNNFYSINL